MSYFLIAFIFHLKFPARLVELHRVLKDTGSLYLHCDSTAFKQAEKVSKTEEQLEMF